MFRCLLIQCTAFKLVSFLYLNLSALVPHVVPQQEPEYMEQPSPTNDSKHLQEDTERAISRAAAEQEERSPEALLNAVCKSTLTPPGSRKHVRKGVLKYTLRHPMYCVCCPRWHIWQWWCRVWLKKHISEHRRWSGSSGAPERRVLRVKKCFLLFLHV